MSDSLENLGKGDIKGKSSEVMTILSATLVTIHKSYLDRPNGNVSEIHLFSRTE